MNWVKKRNTFEINSHSYVVKYPVLILFCEWTSNWRLQIARSSTVMKHQHEMNGTNHLFWVNKTESSLIFSISKTHSMQVFCMPAWGLLLIKPKPSYPHKLHVLRFRCTWLGPHVQYLRVKDANNSCIPIRTSGYHFLSYNLGLSLQAHIDNASVFVKGISIQ